MIAISALLLLAAWTAAERSWAQLEPHLSTFPSAARRRSAWLRPATFDLLSSRGETGQAAVVEAPAKRFMSMKGESNTRTGKRSQLQQLFSARSVPYDAWDIDLGHLGPAPPSWRRNERLNKVKFVSGIPIMRYGRRRRR